MQNYLHHLQSVTFWSLLYRLSSLFLNACLDYYDSLESLLHSFPTVMLLYPYIPINTQYWSCHFSVWKIWTGLLKPVEKSHTFHCGIQSTSTSQVIILFLSITHPLSPTPHPAGNTVCIPTVVRSLLFPTCLPYFSCPFACAHYFLC